MLKVDPPPPKIESAQRVFIEIEARPANPYPGQQTRILYRVFHSLPLSEGELNEPEAIQAQVFRSGRERNYPVVRDGRLVGLLHRGDLLRALLDLGPQPAPPGDPRLSKTL